MSDPSAGSSNSDPSYQDQLNELISEYLEESLASNADKRRKILEENPALANELKDFFELHDRLQGIAQTGSLESSSSGSAETISQQRSVGFKNLAATDDRVFGDYQIIKMIARGGMGVVYKARQISLNRIVALKLILSGDLANADEVRRFQTEAEAAAKLEHPNIVPIFEVNSHDDNRYFSMAFVQGPSLAEKISQQPLPPYEAAELTMKIAQAVAYAHKQGVIHRDLKPANILLTEKMDSGSSDNHDSSSSGTNLEKSFYSKSRFLPKITDFGLAKRIDESAELTSTGQILGTPSYMSPEQAAGKIESVNESSDICSIGAILYACLTGQPPHENENKLETILDVINADPVSVRDFNAKIPKPLATICHKCLEKEPRNRYRSASELAEDLHRCLNREPIVAKPANPLTRIWKWARQRPALAVTLASLFVFFLIYLFDANVLSARFSQSPVDARVGPNEDAMPGAIWLLVLCWVGAATMFQVLNGYLKHKEVLTYLWASFDVVMLTAILWVARGVESPAVVFYPLLVAGTGLRYRIGLVWMVCGVSIIGYWWLVSRSDWLTPQSHVAASQPIYYSICFVMIALIMHLLLYRIQQISSSER